MPTGRKPDCDLPHRKKSRVPSEENKLEESLLACLFFYYRVITYSGAFGTVDVGCLPLVFGFSDFVILRKICGQTRRVSVLCIKLKAF